MQKPDLSIVIPVRNMERFLAETLDSVLEQSASAIDVVVVEDGSTDGSARIASGVAARDNRVRLIDGPCRGVSAARNAGAAAARAEALLFLDADDLLSRDAVARLVAALKAAPDAVAALGGVSRIDVEGRPLPGSDNRELAPDTRDGQLRALLAKNYVVNGGNLAVRRASFEAWAGFDPDLTNGEDWVFWCRLATLGRFVILPGAPVLKYRQVPGGANSRPRRPFERVSSIETIARDVTIRSAIGDDLGRLLRARRVDYFWSGVRNDLLYGAPGRALLAALAGVVVYPDGLARPELIRRFVRSLAVRP